MRPKVFISQWIPQNGLELIKQYCDVDYNSNVNPLEKEEFIKHAKEADALIMFVTDKIDAEIISKCPHLRIISSFGKGYDNIDVDACSKANILVTINSDTLTNSTADLAIGLLLSLCRNILPGNEHIRRKEFKGWHPTNMLGRDFHNSKLGIIGLGAIGAAIARRAQAFEVVVSYYDLVRKIELEKTFQINYCQNIEDLFKQNDFIIVCADLRPESYHLISSKELNYLKEGSYLINISRGSVVDERAIANALQIGKLKGYAADVFEFEDSIKEDTKMSYIYPDLLKSSNNTVFTPHIGTGTKEAREHLAISTVQQLLSALQGIKPPGALNNIQLTKLF